MKINNKKENKWSSLPLLPSSVLPPLFVPHTPQLIKEMISLPSSLALPSLVPHQVRSRRLHMTQRRIRRAKPSGLKARRRTTSSSGNTLALSPSGPQPTSGCTTRRSTKELMVTWPRHSSQKKWPLRDSVSSVPRRNATGVWRPSSGSPHSRLPRSCHHPNDHNRLLLNNPPLTFIIYSNS